MSKIVKIIGREIINSVVTRLLKPKYIWRVGLRRYGSCSVRCFYWFP